MASAGAGVGLIPGNVVSGGVVEVYELRPHLEDAARSLILAGLGEHWGTVDPALNRDLDDFAATYADGTSWWPVTAGEWSAPARSCPEINGPAEIVRMSVALAYRRTGTGRRLVDELVECARRWGMDRVVPETSAHWTEVAEFYLRCGFTQTHFEQGEFGRDAWFEMRLEGQVESGDETAP